MRTANAIRPVHIRWMIRRDMPEILAIESASFTEPWNQDDFEEALRWRNTIGMVAEHDERIVGYMVYRLMPKRIRLFNMAVHPDHRRRDIGFQMVAKLVGKLGSGKRNRIIACVRESNMDACLFLRYAGFRAFKVIREYYPDTNEDAYAFRYKLS